MSTMQTISPQPISLSAIAPEMAKPFRLRRHIGRFLFWFGTWFLAFNCASATYSGLTLRNLAIHDLVASHQFDFFRWEIEHMTEKVRSAWSQPAADLSTQEATTLVRDYLQRAEAIDQHEHEINEILSQNENQATHESKEVQVELDDLRQQQEAVRPTVEQIIEQQVSWAITEAGIEWWGYPLPPVQFTFAEAPKKLIVSPRDRIDTVYGQMIDAAIPLAAAEEAEAHIYQQENLSAYITSIGGLGVYPALVVPRGSIAWILSTVAHEWVHNYLSFYPLGSGYGNSSDIIVINETVAELVGDALGRKVLQKFYPEDVPPRFYRDTHPKDDYVGPKLPPPEPEFSFNKEMGETRRVVDLLLKYGRVGDAETYMEARRMLFVENGVPLRVLNQAYFAFHGSYADSPAGPSIVMADPINPKIMKLWKLIPDVFTFLQELRSVTDVEGLNQVVEKWK